MPVKNLAEIINGYPFDSDRFDPVEGTPLVRIRDIGSTVPEAYYKGDIVPSAVIASGDVLIGMDGDFNVGRWRGGGMALLNQRVCCIRGESETTTKLLEYALPQPLKQINEVTYSTTVKHLSSFQIEKIRVAIPPDSAERSAIVTFLDRETDKIDTLVDEQRRLVGLLKEKRQAVIFCTVTKGLDPNVPMKDSGVEWLGQVPEHWEISRIGTLFGEASDPGEDQLPILSVSIHEGVSDAELDPEEMDRKVTRSEDRTKYKRVLPGDLVYNMMRAWQGGFGAVLVDGMVSPAYVVARPRRELATPYVEAVLRTPNAVEEMRRHSRGITDFRLRLYWEEFKSIAVPYPPIDEQKRILAQVDQVVSELDALRVQTEHLIALLLERRDALISAAVTGKIDVRAQVSAETEAT